MQADPGKGLQSGSPKRSSSPTKRIVLSIIALVLVTALVIGAWTFIDAYNAGVLPWQPDPTRPAITPFSDLPGSATPTAAP